MARLRWGAEVPGDAGAARQRLVDAAETCFRRYGVMKTTVEDVAVVAQVSRATVYRYFAGREELILGVVLREAERFLGRLRGRIEAEERFEDAIVNGVVYTLKAVRRDENLALLFTPETAGVTTTVAGASEALFALTARFLRPYLEAAAGSGVLRPGIEPDEAAEWVLRTILSLLSVDGPRSRNEAELRAFLHAYLVPALVVPAAAPRRTAGRSRPDGPRPRSR